MNINISPLSWVIYYIEIEIVMLINHNVTHFINTLDVMVQIPGKVIILPKTISSHDKIYEKLTPRYDSNNAKLTPR